MFLAALLVVLPHVVFGGNPSEAISTAVGEARLDDPLGGVGVRDLIARVIRVLLGLSGAFALLMFVWGGILWMSSQGDEGKIKKGQKTLQWATIGLALIFGAYAILNFYISALTDATQ